MNVQYKVRYQVMDGVVISRSKMPRNVGDKAKKGAYLSHEFDAIGEKGKPVNDGRYF